MVEGPLGNDEALIWSGGDFRGSALRLLELVDTLKAGEERIGFRAPVRVLVLACASWVYVKKLCILCRNLFFVLKIFFR